MKSIILILIILSSLLISGCEDKLTPEEMNSIVNEANRLRSACNEQIHTSYTMLNKVDDATYSSQLYSEFMACNDYRGYLYDNLNVLDYNEKRERDNWGTNELSRLDQNDEANEEWYNNHRDDNSAYQPIITPTITKTPIPRSTTNINGNNILIPQSKCFHATEDAKEDARRMGQPTEKINQAISICENSYKYYEDLPLGSYSFDGITINYNQQYRRDMMITIQEASIKWLKTILNPDNIFYDNEFPDPADPVPYN